MRWYHIPTLLIAFAPAAWATPLPDGGVTAQEVASVLQERGFQALIATDKAGDLMIRSSSGGVKFVILFYGCKKGSRCRSIQFTAGFSTSGIEQDKIANWNKSWRFGRAYLDNDSDPWVEMDIDAEYGMTSEALGSNLDRWASVLGQFSNYLHR